MPSTVDHIRSGESSPRATPEGLTSKQMSFVELAIDEVQQAHRFLETKAGLLLTFESSLLAILLTLIIENLGVIRPLLADIPVVYLQFLGVCTIVYLVILTAQMLTTISVIFPVESPEHCVRLEGCKPARLFFLCKTDSEGRIQPSVRRYLAKLKDMGHDEILQEYIFELEKLSTIRKLKSDQLIRSFRLLKVLIAGAVLLGLLTLIGFFV